MARLSPVRLYWFPFIWVGRGWLGVVVAYLLKTGFDSYVRGEIWLT
jgi:hypothetical protein